MVHCIAHKIETFFGDFLLCWVFGFDDGKSPIPKYDARTKQFCSYQPIKSLKVDRKPLKSGLQN